jgi:RHS repeat-associated protein
MLSTLWRTGLGLAAEPAPPPTPRPGGSAADADASPELVVGRLPPISVQWARPDGVRPAAVLFDGDSATSLRTGGPADIQVGLSAEAPVYGLGVYGGADGTLSVAAVGYAGHEEPISGLQNIDLGSLPRRWNRFWVKSTVRAGQLALHWRPRTEAAALHELELWGLRADDVSRRSELADRLASRVPEGAVEAHADPGTLSVSSLDVAGDGVASFKVRFDADPRLLGRLFLVYELSGLPHFSGAIRQINGYAVQGGFHSDLGARGGTQVEEIAPEWLFKGDNEIRFLPVSDADPIGYRVSHVRLVGMPGPAAPASAQPVGDLARLSDHDGSTGIRGRSGQTSTTIPVPNGEQPAVLTLNVAEPLSGKVAVQALSADGKTSGQEVVLHDMKVGWHTLSLAGLPPGGAGLRLTWNPGREGTGLISEVRLATSPNPEGRGRAVKISYPLHGECVDHQAYLRGFVTPVGLDPTDRARPVHILVGNEVVDGALEPDGSFGFTVDEPTRGQPWNVAVRARYADGQEVTRDVAIDACTDRPLLVKAPDTGGPRPVIEDEGAPFGKTILAAKGGTIEAEGVTLQIPAGALEKDTRITVRPLVDAQIPKLEELMDNITPEKRGVRLGPHNLQFKRPVRITLSYAKHLVPNGIDPDDLGIFYYDEPGGSWRQIQAVGEPDGHELVADTTHFTDFIAATLAKPDHPVSQSFSANTRTDMKIGDPMAGVTLIQPPTPRNDGAAHLSFPIDIPPGRQGMQPHLTLEYSSDKGNGWMGPGWDISMSKIEVDTRFGVPRYDRSVETERYLLDGEELVPTDPSTVRTLLPRTFRLRKEGRFAKITRFAYDLDWGFGYYWEVKDKSGVTSVYGFDYPQSQFNQGNHILFARTHNHDPGETFNAAAWAITRSTDTFCNTVAYRTTTRHVRDPGTEFAGWDRLEYKAIEYTRLMTQGTSDCSTDLGDLDSTNGKHSFEIRFRQSATQNRNDVPSSARVGGDVREPSVLDGLDVVQMNADGTEQTVRKYDFDYVSKGLNAFGKYLLSGFRVSDPVTGGSLSRHIFTYTEVPRDSTGAVKFGAAPQVVGVPFTANGQTQGWNPPASDPNPLPAGHQVSASSGTSTFWSLFVAGGPLAPTLCYPHVGGGYSSSSNDSSTSEKFLDVNGDGLPDLIRADGTVLVNGFAKDASGNIDHNHGVFTEFTNVLGTSTSPLAVGHSSTEGSTMSVGLHFPGELGGGGSSTETRVQENIDFADMDGDGLPDYFTGTDYFHNASRGGATAPVAFSTKVQATNTHWQGLEADTFLYDASWRGASHDPSKNFLTAPVVRWTAPFAGRIAVNAPAFRWVFDGVHDAPSADPVTAKMFTVVSTIINNVWTWTFDGLDSSDCGPPAGVFNTATPWGAPLNSCGSGDFVTDVSAGDQIVFEAESRSGIRRNLLGWNPNIRYLSTPEMTAAPTTTEKEAYGPPRFVFDLTSDFRLAGLPATMFTSTSADSDAAGTLLVANTPTKVQFSGHLRKLTATGDDVAFQVVRIRNGVGTVVWPTSGVPMTVTAGATTDVDMSTIAPITVQGRWVQQSTTQTGPRWTVQGDQLIFQVVSDTPIDPKAIDWQPSVEYVNFCQPNPTSLAALAQSAKNTVPNPSTVGTTCASGSSALGTRAKQQFQAQLPQFRGVQKPTTENGGLALFQAPNDGTSRPYQVLVNGTLTPSGTFTNDSIGRVVVVVQVPGQANPLIFKKRVDLTSTTAPQAVSFTTPTFQMASPQGVGVTAYVYGRHVFDASVLVADLSPTGNDNPWTFRTVHLSNPPLAGSQAMPGPMGSQGTTGSTGNEGRDPMAGGYHQWNYGFANLKPVPAFTPSQLVYSSTSTAFENQQFFSGKPAPFGTASLPNPDFPGLTGQLWSGPGGGDYLAPGFFRPSAYGQGGERPLPLRAGTFRRSTSHNQDFSVNAILTLDFGDGSTANELELIDMNGDRLPDVLGYGRVAFNGFLSSPLAFPGGSAQTTITSPAIAGRQAFDFVNPDPAYNFPGFPRNVDQSTAAFGLSLGSIASVVQNVVNASGGSEGLGTNLPSFGLSSSSSRTTKDLVDINGDGLPDVVTLNPDGTRTTYLNLGYQFSQPEAAFPFTGPIALNSGQAVISNIGAGFFGTDSGSVNHKAALNNLNALRMQESVRNSFQVNIFGIGGGPQFSASRTILDLVDMNGDGLPDQVIKQAGTDNMYVQYNMGTAFTAADTWKVPAWGFSVQSGKLVGVADANLGLGSNDTLAFSQSADLAVSGGFPVMIPLFFIDLCLIFEDSVGGSSTKGNNQMSLMDINGDGLPDQVFKRNDLNFDPLLGITASDERKLWVKLNPAGGANLLRRVENSFGGSFDLEYSRAGNEVDLANKIDVPENHWVMSAVTVHSHPVKDVVTGLGTNLPWNGDPDQRTEYAYQKGFYSRAERDFLGFGTVVSTRKKSDGSIDSTVEEQYLTDDVYSKGLLKQRVERDGPIGTGKVFDVLQMTRPAPITLALGTTTRPIKFFAEETKTVKHLEGSTTDPAATGGVSSTEHWVYGTLSGGVVTVASAEAAVGYALTYEDLGDTGTADDVSYTIPTTTAADFFTSSVSNIYQVKPKHILVKNGSTTLRERTVTYLARGEMDTASDTLIGGTDPSNNTAYTNTKVTWTYGYDRFGNVNSYTEPKASTEPKAYNVTVSTFDALTNSHPETMIDSFGYSWSQKTDPRSGQVTDTTDINGIHLQRQQDAYFRLTSLSDVTNASAPVSLVTASYNAAIGTFSNPGDQPANAVVRQIPATGGQIVTKTFVDGWGKVIQVITPALVDSGGAFADTGLRFSGRVAYDARGRLASRGQTKFVLGQLTVEATNISLTAAANPTTSSYDIMSRPTETDFPLAPPDLPAGSNIKTAYSLGTLTGSTTVRRLEQVTDPNGKIRKTYRDGRDRIVAVVERNTIAGTAKDIPTTYTYDPLDRITQVTQVTGSPAVSKNTTAVWDSMDHVVSLTSPDAGQVQWFYDPQNRQVAKQTPNLTSTTRIKYVYDQNRLKTIDYPTSTDVTFTYGSAGSAPAIAAHAVGRISRRDDESGFETYEYDQLGAVSKRTRSMVPNSGITQAPPYTTSYVYDEAVGRIVSMTFPDNELVSYNYDSAGQLSSIASSLTTYVSDLRYDDQGSRKTITYGNGVKTVYTYDPPMRRLKNIDTTVVASGKVIQKIAFTTYDANGNLKKLDNTSPNTGPTNNISTATVNQTFTYDDLNQLLTGVGRYNVKDNSHRDYSVTMTYDDIGNVKTKNQTDNLTPATGAVQPQGKTTYNWSYTYDTARAHRPTNVGPQAITYDNDGNQKTSTGTSTPDNRTMVWNDHDLMSQVTDSGSFVTKFLYGGDDERSHKRYKLINDVYYVNPNYVVKNAQTTAIQTTRHVTIGDERVASVVTVGTTRTPFYYHGDQLHSSNYVTNSTANLVQHTEYLPSGETWVGEVKLNDPANSQPYMFNAKELDESGLYYFGARYFDPRTTLWQSTDPILANYMSGKVNGGVFQPRNLGLYSYTWNNPVVLRDPDGLSPIEIGMEVLERVEESPAGQWVARAAGSIVGAALGLLMGSGLGRSPYPTVDSRYFTGGGREQIRQELSQPLMNENGGAKPATPAAPATAAEAERAKSVAKGIPESQIGPSGKPKIHTADMPNRKAAEDAAKSAGSGKPMKHPNDKGQPPHFHPTDANGNKIPGPHFNFPPRSAYPKQK